jgi:hypothetical protein
MSYEEEDTCHMRRRIHGICGIDRKSKSESTSETRRGELVL